MGLESGIGIGLYVAGVVMLFQVIAEKFPKRKQWLARLALAITFGLLGALLMIYV